MHNRTMGWSREEDELLFSEAETGKARGIPLRTVFETVAAKTGRMPNSVRNHFYARLREGSRGGLTAAAFVPFTAEETHELLKEVLRAVASGESVRAATFRLAEGDPKRMLRYQNKYRAALTRDPALLERIAAELRAEGIDAHAALNRRGACCHVADAETAIAAINSLAKSAGENSALRSRLRRQSEELEAQRERFRILQDMFDRLVEVSRELAQGGLSPESRAELMCGIEDCERRSSLLGRR